MRDLIKNILLAIFIGLTGISLFKYPALLKERNSLIISLGDAKEEIRNLTEKEQVLSRELEKEKQLRLEAVEAKELLKDYLSAASHRMSKLFMENDLLQKDKEQINCKFSLLKAENLALVNYRAKILGENEGFKVKLSSVDELKKAIRELKYNLSRSPQDIKEGNRGFVIKDGKCTSPSRIKIEVFDAPNNKD